MANPTGERTASGKVLRHTPSSAIAAGELVLVGSLVGYAPKLIPANTVGDLQLEGEFELDAEDDTAWAQGDVLYADFTAGEITKTSTSNTRVGHAALAKTEAEAVGRVRLEQLT